MSRRFDGRRDESLAGAPALFAYFHVVTEPVGGMDVVRDLQQFAFGAVVPAHDAQTCGARRSPKVCGIFGAQQNALQVLLDTLYRDSVVAFNKQVHRSAMFAQLRFYALEYRAQDRKSTRL